MTSSVKRPLDDAAAEAAVLWMVRLHSGEMSSQEREAFEAWHASDSRNAAAFGRIQRNLGAAPFSQWRGRATDPLLQALNAPNGRRQFLRNSLVFGGLAISLGLFGRAADWPWLAPGNLQTGTAERRRWQLEDGSLLQLNARSRVSTDLVDGHRQLQLHQGELLLEIHRGGVRPFQLETQQGTVSASGGRLVLRQGDEASRLTTLDGPLLLRPKGGAEIQISAGQSVLFDRYAVLEQQPMNSSETAWLDGWLEARKQPLGEVVDTLRSYRPGIIRLDPYLAALPVSGLYPLDNSDQTLEMLERQLPIRVHRFSAYWISIEQA